jgi:hypothetical protein
MSSGSSRRSEPSPRTDRRGEGRSGGTHPLLPSIPRARARANWSSAPLNRRSGASVTRSVRNQAPLAGNEPTGLTRRGASAGTPAGLRFPVRGRRGRTRDRHPGECPCLVSGPCERADAKAYLAHCSSPSDGSRRTRRTRSMCAAPGSRRSGSPSIATASCCRSSTIVRATGSKTRLVMHSCESR